VTRANLENRVALRVCADQPFDVSGSKADLGLAVTACEPSGGLGVEVSSAPCDILWTILHD
jgi:hypothetical protein